MFSEKELKMLAAGNNLLQIFLAGCVICGCFVIFGMLGKIPNVSDYHAYGFWIVCILHMVLVLAAIFWIGILLLYRYSVQMGVRFRAWGLIVGMIPIVHLVMLFKILSVTKKEYRTEKEQVLRNKQRKDEQICATKYPILMVHGVFFRDFRYMNYWGRVPEVLEYNGAKIFYGNQQSAGSIVANGEELSARILEICEKEGCDKVNVIAHSKGGLDTRYALQLGDTASHVASLTTINTPHRGCIFADALLEKIGDKEKEIVANAYNTALRKLGDKEPDFMAAVWDLTASKLAEFNQNCPDKEGVYYQSFGSKLNVSRGGRFPLNMSTHLVKYYDGANDGLVGEGSFPWGQDYTFLTVKGNRGISHGDMIDLNRENIDEFDVREFYVSVLKKLKDRGF